MAKQNRPATIEEITGVTLADLNHVQRLAHARACQAGKVISKTHMDLVYFLQCGEFVKIGHAANLGSRLKGFQTHSPFVMKLVAFDFEKAECNWHSLFFEEHWTGEWFRLSPRMLDQMGVLAEGMEDALKAFNALLEIPPKVCA